jgi:aminoglycoside phosphotransferase (APT) family kinase protein
VLVDGRGAISGIIDWGDMARGDKATDLACVWMLLPTAVARRAAMEAYEVANEALWARAIGWAVLFAALLLETGLQNHPRHARMGEFTLHNVAADAGAWR